jgi:hypothetical protein
MLSRFRLGLFVAFSLVALGGCLVVEEDPGPGPDPVDPGPDPGDPPPPDPTVTCNQFDDFNQLCTGNCAPTWDCDAAYASLDYDTQVDLDVCSDCLVDNVANGVCADCSDPTVGIESCQAFMEQLLGLDCW